MLSNRLLAAVFFSNKMQLDSYGCSWQKYSSPLFIKYVSPDWMQIDRILSFDKWKNFPPEDFIRMTPFGRYWSQRISLVQSQVAIHVKKIPLTQFKASDSLEQSMSLSSGAESPGICSCRESLTSFVYPNIKIVPIAMS